MAASREPRAAAIRRAVPAASASNTGDLPLDAMYEVLLRLPAKLLCRLRVVCRPWRCLLSDPRFAAAHVARHREPLIIAGCLDTAGRDSLVDILDLSGKIVKRMRGEESDIVVSMAFDLVCVKEIETGSFRLLNPATGAVCHLPDKLAEEHAARGFRLRDYGEPVHLFGQVASTGECKVLRMLPYRQNRNRNRGDLFEVCTVNSSSHVQWRAKQAPPASFVWNEWTRVVVGGVAHFLSVAAYFAVMNRRVTEQDWIISFDLEAEVWRSIRGPGSLVEDAIDMLNSRHDRQITLANLNGSLVIVHGSTPYMDLWFLMDSEKDLWVKQYSVEVERCGHLLPMHPLLVLEDGRLVTLIRCMRLLQIYDPRTNSFTNLMELRHSSVISMYTGSLLSLDGEN